MTEIQEIENIRKELDSIMNSSKEIRDEAFDTYQKTPLIYLFKYYVSDTQHVFENGTYHEFEYCNVDYSQGIEGAMMLASSISEEKQPEQEDDEDDDSCDVLVSDDEHIEAIMITIEIWDSGMVRDKYTYEFRSPDAKEIRASVSRIRQSLDSVAKMDRDVYFRKKTEMSLSF